MKWPIVLGVFVVLTTLSCRDRGTPSEPPVKPQPYHYGYQVPGLIIASFVDTVRLAEAQTFVRGFGLTPLDFSHYETDPLRSGTIGVPVGEEDFWVDSLNTYPLFIREASRLAMVVTS